MSVLWEGKVKARKGYCCPMGLKRFVNLTFRKTVAKMWSSDFNTPIFASLQRRKYDNIWGIGCVVIAFNYYQTYWVEYFQNRVT